MDAPAFHTETTSDRRSAFVQVGTESVVELAEPTSADTRLAVDLAEHGELPHAMTFKVADLDAVERHLVDVGIGVAERSDTSIVADPADLSNAVIAFTTRQLPATPACNATAVPFRERFISNDGLRIRYLDSDPSRP